MSFADLVSLAGIPGLGTACHIAQATYIAVDNVKINRQQCRSLSNRCVVLLLAVRESAAESEGKAADFVAEVETTISKIHHRIKDWADWSMLKSITKRNDTKAALDEFNREIDICLMKFNMQIQLEMSRNGRVLADVQQRDHAEFKEALLSLLKNQDRMAGILDERSPEVVEGIVDGLQTVLRDPGLEPDQEETLKQGLWTLHTETSLLPRIIDLTDQVNRTSDNPIIPGFHTDIYTGVWLGREKVALRLPRMLSPLVSKRKRFLSEVQVWRKLEHPNILTIYGTASVRDHIYIVSPWMDHGNILNYLEHHPNIRRQRILLEVANALEYLHSNQILHGELCGANILIAVDGSSRVSNYGLSKLMEEVYHEQHTVPTNNANLRWTSPEVIGSKRTISVFSDVWSYGMVCLEVMTGDKPFSNIQQDVAVMLDIIRGKIPDRPGPVASSRGLDNAMWDLLKHCWRKKPESRPTMSSIVITLRRIAKPDYSNIDSAGSSRQSTCSEEFNLTRQRSKFSFTKYRRPSTADSTISQLSTGSASRFPAIPFFTSTERKGKRSAENVSLEDSDRNVVTVDNEEVWELSPYPYQPSDAEPPSHASKKASLPSLLHSASDLPGDQNEGVSAGRDNIAHVRIVQSLSSVNTTYSQAGATSRLTQTPITLCNSAGVVEAGDIAGLVGHLLHAHAGKARQDTDYLNSFFTTFTAFSSDAEVYSLLVERFYDVRLEKDPKARAETKFSVLAVLKHWLTLINVPIDFAVLLQAKEFALSVNTSPTMTRLARELVEKASQNLSTTQDSKLFSHSPLLTSIPVSSSVSPQDLACALTALEGEAYGKILPTDYMVHIQQSKTSQVEAASEINNRVVFWVKQTMLKPETVQARAAVFRFLINTAEGCRRMRNFASLSAILDGLQSSIVSRLRLTVEGIGTDAKQTFTELGRLLEPDFNHRAYRATLRASNEPTVPWIAVHLVDLSNIWRKLPSTVVNEGHSFINFTKYSKLAALMKDDLHYKPPIVSNDVAAPLAYLKKELASVHVDSLTEEHLLKRSLALEAAEKIIRDRKIRELRSCGFRTTSLQVSN